MEVAGALIVCVLAPLFHFLFEWSGSNHFVGLFAAVNESVWEHTKIVFPFLFVAIAQYFIVKPDFRPVYRRENNFARSDYSFDDYLLLHIP